MLALEERKQRAADILVEGLLVMLKIRDAANDDGLLKLSDAGRPRPCLRLVQAEAAGEPVGD